MQRRRPVQQSLRVAMLHTTAEAFLWAQDRERSRLSEDFDGNPLRANRYIASCKDVPGLSYPLSDMRYTAAFRHPTNAGFLR